MSIYDDSELTQYRTGDIIEKADRSGDGSCFVRVTERMKNVKNGRPGFHGDVVTKEGKPLDPQILKWGYDDQVIRVVTPTATPLADDFEEDYSEEEDENEDDEEDYDDEEEEDEDD